MRTIAYLLGGYLAFKILPLLPWSSPRFLIPFVLFAAVGILTSPQFRSFIPSRKPTLLPSPPLSRDSRGRFLPRKKSRDE